MELKRWKEAKDSRGEDKEKELRAGDFSVFCFFSSTLPLVRVREDDAGRGALLASIGASTLHSVHFQAMVDGMEISIYLATFIHSLIRL